jgi:chaperone modulatory protein CbpM
MQNEEMIPALEFCSYYRAELSFLEALKESGLVKVITVNERLFVPANQLPQLEKLANLYYEMGINVEGIETISYLLERVNALQQQVTELSNRLDWYENR